MKFQLSTLSLILTLVIAQTNNDNASASSLTSTYIIKLKDETSRGLNTHLNYINALFKTNDDGKSTEPSHVKEIYGSLNSLYTAELTIKQVETISKLKEVAYVEKDSKVQALSQQSNAPWGLARISQRPKLPPTGPYTYNYNGEGAGVAAYILDTGVLITHPEFGGRAVYGKTFPAGVDVDQNGHGTHVAGIVGSNTYGVAKKATIVSVKVLDASGAGSISNIISGINWVVDDKRGTKGNVINLSIGGSKSQALNDAVTNAFNKGFLVVTAAGNSNTDACSFSPASAPLAITVGTSDINDVRYSASNYGACVDLFAPGVNILSTWLNDQTKVLSGSSMAAAHVTGLVAYYLGNETLNPQQATNKIITTATNNALTGVGNGSPNKLANNNFS